MVTGGCERGEVDRGSTLPPDGSAGRTVRGYDGFTMVRAASSLESWRFERTPSTMRRTGGRPAELFSRPPLRQLSSLRLGDCPLDSGFDGRTLAPGAVARRCCEPPSSRQP